MPRWVITIGGALTLAWGCGTPPIEPVDAGVDSGPAVDAGADADTGPTGFLSVSVENGTNCALHASGQAVCWGAGFDEPLVIEGPVDEVTAGAGFACVRRGTAISCPTSPYLGEVETAALNAVPEGDYVAVSAGADWGCAIRMDGGLRCWGTEDPPVEEQPLDPDERFERVRLDWRAACALTLHGSVQCFGRPADRVPPLENPPYTAFATGRGARCGVGADGSLDCVSGWCGPSEEDGEERCHDVFLPVRDEDGGSRSVPWSEAVGPGPGGIFTKVSLDNYVCGLRPDGELACWGSWYDQPWSDQPALRDSEPEGRRFRDVDVAIDYVCGVTTDGELLCWGRGTNNGEWGQAEPPAWP